MVFYKVVGLRNSYESTCAGPRMETRVKWQTCRQVVQAAQTCQHEQTGKQGGVETAESVGGKETHQFCDKGAFTYGCTDRSLHTGPFLTAFQQSTSEIECMSIIISRAVIMHMRFCQRRRSSSSWYVAFTSP